MVKERGSVVVPVSLAVTVPSRARGLLLGGDDRGALLLAPCRDVHTVGMSRRIDVAFIDAAGTVLEAYRNVGACCRLRNGSAVAVLERLSDNASVWFEPGDRMGLALLPASSRHDKGGSCAGAAACCEDEESGKEEGDTL